jgi:hypothetical protein
VIKLGTSQETGRTSFASAHAGGAHGPPAKAAKVDSKGRVIGERNAKGDEELIKAVEENGGFFSAASAALQARWGRDLKKNKKLKDDYNACDDPEAFKADWAKALGPNSAGAGDLSPPAPPDVYVYLSIYR